jgi:ectoine hydroxylase-related dioxygenase (phytanoyl-CoA dioxygenase family)
VAEPVGDVVHQRIHPGQRAATAHPGLHRVDRNPVDALPLGCEMGPHPAEMKVVAPAGSVILFNNADLWHSGTFNYSPAPRLAVTATFLRGRAPVLMCPPGRSGSTAAAGEVLHPPEQGLTRAR